MAWNNVSSLSWFFNRILLQILAVCVLIKLPLSLQEGLEAQEKVQGLTSEVKKLQEENKTLTENYNSERVLRKKYYNMVEDMKGKIRVYCRSRPLSGSELERVRID